MGKIYDVVTVGCVVRDITLFTGDGQIFKAPGSLTVQRVIGFEYGAKVRVPRALFSIGGGAANVAVALQRLGLKTAIISRIGLDAEGRHLRSDLLRGGVNVDCLQQDARGHTACSCIIASTKQEHDHVVFVYRGANDNLLVRPESLSHCRGRWYYVTALCGPRWITNLKAVFGAAARVGARVMWNPGGEQLAAGRRMLERFLRQTDVLLLNKDEAIELALSGMKLGKRNPRFLNKPLYLLNILSEWGPKTVVITDGSRGAYALSGGRVYRQRAVRRRVLDTTGVGDAFGAAFVAALLEGKGSVPEALRWGVLNAASNLTKIGAQDGLLDRAGLLQQRSRLPHH